MDLETLCISMLNEAWLECTVDRATFHHYDRVWMVLTCVYEAGLVKSGVRASIYNDYYN